MQKQYKSNKRDRLASKTEHKYRKKKHTKVFVPVVLACPLVRQEQLELYCTGCSSGSSTSGSRVYTKAHKLNRIQKQQKQHAQCRCIRITEYDNVLIISFLEATNQIKSNQIESNQIKSYQTKLLLSRNETMRSIMEHTYIIFILLYI